MVFLPLSMRGESWGSYFVFLQPNSLTLHIAALGDGKCTENITKFEFIKNLFLLKPATATLVKKKAPAIPEWHYWDYAGFQGMKIQKQFQAIKQIWQPPGPSDTPGVSVLTLLAEPSANPASPLSASPHRALQLLAQEGPLQLPAHKRQSQSARICKSLR